MTASWRPASGTILDDRFVLGDELGVGPTGVVFAAHLVEDDASFAVKVLHPALFVGDARGPNQLRLRRARTLDAPGLVPLREIQIDVEPAFVTMDLLTCPTLETWAQDGKLLSLDDLLHIVRSVADVLTAIHQLGVHGDLKPANVFIEDGGRVLVTDPWFLEGLSEVDAAEGLAPREDTWLAPEQTTPGWQERPETDTYRLALLVGWLLGGRVPTGGESLAGQGIDVAPAVDAAFLRATHAEPGERHLSVDAFVTEIADALTAAQADKDEDRAAEVALSETVEAGADAVDGFPDPELVDPVGDTVDPDVQALGDATDRDAESDGAPADRAEAADGDADGDAAAADAAEEDEPSDERMADGEDAGEQEPDDTPSGRSSLETAALPMAEIIAMGFDPEFGEGIEEIEAVMVAAGQPDAARPFDPESDEVLELIDDDVLELEPLPESPRKRTGTTTQEEEIPAVIEAGVDTRSDSDQLRRVSVAPPLDAATEEPAPAVLSGEAQLPEGSAARSATRARWRRSPIIVIAPLLLLVSLLVSAFVLNVILDHRQRSRSVPGMDSPVPSDRSKAKAPVGAAGGQSANLPSPTAGGDQGTGSPSKDAPPSDAKPRDTAGDSGDLAGTPPGKSTAVEGTTVSTTARPDTVRCPADMVKVQRQQDRRPGQGTDDLFGVWCLDAHEYPGSGRAPRTRVTHKEAGELCAERGRRLCTRREWRVACGGRYPYGRDYQDGACNTAEGRGKPSPLRASGSMKACVSESGAFDMVGNASEWTVDGRVNGGSSHAEGRYATCYRSGRRSGSRDEIGFRCCTDPTAPEATR